MVDTVIIELDDVTVDYSLAEVIQIDNREGDIEILAHGVDDPDIVIFGLEPGPKGAKGDTGDLSPELIAARDTAVTAAGQATDAKTASETAEANAQQHSTDAQGFASEADADRVQTGLDRAAVAADKATVATAKDDAVAASTLATTKAQATSDDAAQTALDRIQTGADRAAVATDRTDVQDDKTVASQAADTAVAAQTATEDLRDQMLALYDSFDDRYLGRKAADPTTDNDGNPLEEGTLYYNTTTKTMMMWEGGAWVAAYVSETMYAKLANNGSDFNATTFRTNLDLYSTSQVDTLITGAKARANHTGTQLAATISDFNTAADLRIAGAVGITVQAFSPVLAGTTASFTTALKTKIDGIEAAADVTDAVNVGASMNGAAVKTTLVDADKLPLNDSAASNALKTISWANLKFVSKAYFDTLYSALGHTHTFASLTSKPTTVSGYGLSDVYTMTQIDGFLSPKASIAYVDGKISDLLGGAPAAALDTIKELADALTDADSDIAAITTSLAGKAALVHTHAISDVTGLQAALDAKLAVSAYTPADVLAKIKTVDGQGSGLDADRLQNLLPQTSNLDTTVGSLMSVGAFGLGKTATLSNPDLNSVRPTGLYYVSAGSNAPGGGGAYGWLIHLDLDADYSYQQFIYSVSATARYARTKRAGVWSRWAREYDQDAVLGTVSQSGNLPTGALIESGTYASGSYVRFADGTQLCFCANVPTAGLQQTQINFPAAFSNTSYVIMGNWVPGPGSDPSGYGMVTNYSQRFVSYLITTTSAASSVGFYTVAIGRWFG